MSPRMLCRAVHEHAHRSICLRLPVTRPVQNCGEPVAHADSESMGLGRVTCEPPPRHLQG